MTEKPPNHKNPFVGPRAIKTGERIYGRERETNQLVNLLIAERIILLYSPSGAGKSSLIHAAMIPKLKVRQFNILPVARVNLEPPAEARQIAGFNRYVYSLLSALEEGRPKDERIPEADLFTMSIADYLERWSDTALVLILDQFEEILTADPVDQGVKQDFFEQLGKALENRSRWALVSMREDYIAALDPYLIWLPTRLSTTFRLDLLSRQAAQQVMQKTALAEGVDFTEPATERLLVDLCRVQVQRPDGSLDIQPGQYVEPVQLQVVCYNLWEKLDPGDTDITGDEIELIGDVDQSLAEFYAGQVAAIAEASGVAERDIREWFENALITSGGIRSQVLMGAEKSQGLDNRTINLLENAHLVRRDTRRGRTWFELTHDSLIRPVRRDNEKWLQENLSLLQRQAVLWERDHRPEHLLLRDEILTQAIAWADAHPDELSGIDREFLEANLAARENRRKARQLQEANVRIQEQQRSASRLRMFLTLTVIAALAAGAFAFLAYRARNEAKSLAITAQAASTLAVANEAAARMQEGTANAASTQAIIEKETANVASTQASYERGVNAIIALTEMAARETAEYASALASTNASLARSRQLAAQAYGYLDSAPNLASLLGIEAYRESPTREAQQVLLSRLQRGLSTKIEAYGQPIPSQSFGEINMVAISPDGRYLAWGGSNNRIGLWDFQTAKLQELRGHTGKVDSVTFSRDSRYLASGGVDEKIYYWDVSGERAVREEDFETTGRVYSLSFSPRGERLAAAVGNQIVLLDLNSGQPQRQIGRFGQRAYFVAWSPDGNIIAGSGADGRVKAWRADGSPLLDPGGHTDKVWNVVWSPDTERLASASEDGSIILWSFPGGQKLATIPKAHDGKAVFSVSFSPDGKILASGGGDNHILFWDVATLIQSGGTLNQPAQSGAQIAQLENHRNIVVSVFFSPNKGKNLLASAGYDSQVAVHELIPQLSLSEALPSAGGEILSVVESEGGETFLARRQGSGITIDSLEGEQSPRTVESRALSAAISPDGLYIAVGGPQGSIRIIAIESGEELTSWESSTNPVASLAFSRDGRYLASSQCTQTGPGGEDRQAACQQSQIDIWDAQSGARSGEPIQVPGGAVTALAFNDEGSRLASGSDDNTIQVWVLGTGESLSGPLSRHTDVVLSLAFSPDGTTLASGSADNEIILWDLDTNQPIAEPLVGTTDQVRSLAFSRIGDRLYAGGSDGTLLRWEVSPQNWVERNCELAGRNFTRREWRQFFGDEPIHPTCDYPLDTPASPTGTPTPGS